MASAAWRTSMTVITRSVAPLFFSSEAISRNFLQKGEAAGSHSQTMNSARGASAVTCSDWHEVRGTAPLLKERGSGGIVVVVVLVDVVMELVVLVEDVVVIVLDVLVVLVVLVVVEVDEVVVVVVVVVVEFVVVVEVVVVELVVVDDVVVVVVVFVDEVVVVVELVVVVLLVVDVVPVVVVPVVVVVDVVVVDEVVDVDWLGSLYSTLTDSTEGTTLSTLRADAVPARAALMVVLRSAPAASRVDDACIRCVQDLK